MKYTKIIVLCLILLTLVSSAAFADGPGPFTKLGRGAANVATGWIEIPKEMVNVTENKNDIMGLFVAPFTGLWKAIVRTVAGAYEIVTFPIPMPAEYEPIVQPEYVLNYD